MRVWSREGWLHDGIGGWNGFVELDGRWEGKRNVKIDGAIDRDGLLYRGEGRKLGRDAVTGYAEDSVVRSVDSGQKSFAKNVLLHGCRGDGFRFVGEVCYFYRREKEREKIIIKMWYDTNLTKIYKECNLFLKNLEKISTNKLFNMQNIWQYS